jgi:hypothetical protein
MMSQAREGSRVAIPMLVLNFVELIWFGVPFFVR